MRDETTQRKLAEIMSIEQYKDETSAAAWIGCSQAAINKLRRHALAGPDLASRIDAAWRRAGCGPSREIEATIRYVWDAYGVPRELAERVAASRRAWPEPMALLTAILSEYRALARK